MISLHVCI